MSSLPLDGSPGMAVVYDVDDPEGYGPFKRLFEMKSQKKPAHWKFIRLVAKHKFRDLPESQLRTIHAASAWCLKCDQFVYCQRASNDARKHMEKHHAADLASFDVSREHVQAQSAQRALSLDFCEGPDAKRKKASVTIEQQARADELMATWIARSLRPFLLVEDDGFREYLNYVVGELGGVELKIPSRAKVRADIVRIAEELREKLKQRLARDCLYYSLTTDVWSDRAQRSYLALTIHYVDSSFQPNNYTLEVQPFPGKHSGVAIAKVIEDAMARWDLSPGRCIKILRDAGSNGVAACNVLEIEHMSCLAHGLHLVVQGALLPKKTSQNKLARQRGEASSVIDGSPPEPRGTTRATSEAEQSGGRFSRTSQPRELPGEEARLDPSIENDDEDDTPDDVLDAFAARDAPELTNEEDLAVLQRLRLNAASDVERFLAASVTSGDWDCGPDYKALHEMRDTVQVFRRIAAYFRRSPKGSSRLLAIQQKMAARQNPPQLQAPSYMRGTEIKLVLDCPTRWSSCWDMLQRFLALQAPVEEFFQYLETPDGAEEFAGVKLTRPSLQQWLEIRCLRLLLAPFASATEALSGERYPTLVMAVPCLRHLRSALQNPTIFAKTATKAGNDQFVQDTINLMQRVRRTFLVLFDKRFSIVSDEMYWITFLDPHMSKTRHLEPSERAQGLQSLLDAAVENMDLQTPPATPDATPYTMTSPIATPQGAKNALLDFLYGSEDEDESYTNTHEGGGGVPGVKERAEGEIYAYLSQTSTIKRRNHVNVFEWWRSNMGTYPTIAPLARKWLGCVATSVPSERAFSTGGNTVTAKRCSLAPEVVRDIVFISENYK